MKKRIRILLAALLLALSLPLHVRAAEEPAWQAYNGKRLGVLVGPLMEDIAHTYFPDSEYLLFNSYPDCISALLSGKIDAYLGDEPGLKSVCAEQPRIDYIRDRITSQEYSFAFRRDDPRSAALCQELNDFLARSRADGTLQEIDDIWFGADEERKQVDMSDLTGEKGTIRVVTTSTDAPFSYIKDGKNVGYDIDLVVRFCRDAGYALELGDVDFSARIPAIQSGKYDFTTDMNVTEERREQVLFSDPTSSGGVVLGILRAPEEESGGEIAIPSFESLRGKRVGIQTGTISGDVAEAVLSDIELSYFNSQTDAMTALRAGKVDAWACEKATAAFVLLDNTDLEMFPTPLDETSLAAVFPMTDEGRELCREYSAFVEALWADGTMEEIDRVWFGPDEDARRVLDYEALPDTNGTLRLALDTSVLPFAYVKCERVVGYDVDIAARFCQARGYRLEVLPMNFDGVLPSLQAGKCDFAACGITVTAERAESVLFSSPTYHSGTVLMLRKGEEAGSGSPWEGLWGGIVSSFHKTFVRESRWKLFLAGVGNTLLITALSILCGTALGFGVFMLCRNGDPLANGVTRFSLWLVQGTPMVVLLMILYYVIFGSVSISGLAVAVIGFTLTFGAAVFGLLKMGVSAIDRGQYEAACALGHSDRSTFFRIILPQAIPHVLPAFQGEIVGLIKATAIVGYIAVQDLTKMGDIVRSRTYEAFFPLIAITVIYFVLEGLFSFLVGRLRLRMDPKKRRRERILKGVDIHD